MTAEQIQAFLDRTIQLRLDQNQLRVYWVHYRNTVSNVWAHFARHMADRTGVNVSRCGHCQKAIFNMHGVSVEDGATRYCTTCADLYCSFCDDCGYRVNTESHVHAPRVLDPQSAERNYGIHVNDYRSQAPLNFFRSKEEEARLRQRLEAKKTDDLIYLGVELECAQTDTAPIDILDTLVASLGRDFILLKRDGSLVGRFPMELVTSPATLAVHRSGIWDKFFADVAPHLVSGQEAHAGMHVHMTAAPISPMTKARMIAMVNARGNEAFMETIAGRAANQYNRKAPDKKATSIMSLKAHNNDCPWHVSNKSKISEISLAIQINENGELMRDDAGRLIVDRKRPSQIIYRSRCTCPEGNYASDHGRYEALNFATSKPTVELRIFNGTVDKARFFANLEFAAALISFCTENYSFSDMTESAFRAWVTGRRKEYPALFAFMVSVGLCVAPRGRAA